MGGSSFNTISAEVICETHEVFVDEKRKRTDLDEGPSKKHDTRSFKKKEEMINTTLKKMEAQTREPRNRLNPLKRMPRRGKID